MTTTSGQAGQKLKLRVDDKEDLEVVSTQLQDAIVPIGDMAYLSSKKQFALVANRFMWNVGGQEPAESDGTGEEQEGDGTQPVYLRTNCGLRFEGVTAVRSRGVDLQDRGQMLELLAVSWAGDAVELHFSGGGAVRLEMPRPVCLMEDIGEPWPTTRKPSHIFEDEAETS